MRSSNHSSAPICSRLIPGRLGISFLTLLLVHIAYDPSSPVVLASSLCFTRLVPTFSTIADSEATRSNGSLNSGTTPFLKDEKTGRQIFSERASLSISVCKHLRASCFVSIMAQQSSESKSFPNHCIVASSRLLSSGPFGNHESLIFSLANGW